jgi:cysteine synthase A
MLYEMLDTEGLYLGASTALNVVAAYELAQQLGPGRYLVAGFIIAIKRVPGKTVVTILCDGAYRYQSRLFSKKWIESKGLSGAIPDHLKKYSVLN